MRARSRERALAGDGEERRPETLELRRTERGGRDDRRHRRRVGRFEDPHLSREPGVAVADQVVAVAVERADVDAPFRERLDHAPRVQQSADDLAVGRRRIRVPRHQVIPEREVAGLRVLQRVARAPAEGVGERAGRRVGAHRDVAPVDRAPAIPGRAGYRRGEDRRAPRPEGEREPAHHHRAEVVARPQLRQELRGVVVNELGRDAGVLEHPREHLAPGGLRRRRHRVHPRVGKRRHHAFFRSARTRMTARTIPT